MSGSSKWSGTVIAAFAVAVFAAPVSASQFIDVVDTTWQWNGFERVFVQGLGRDTSYSVGSMSFFDDGSFEVVENGSLVIQESYFEQVRARVLTSVSYDDIERIIQSFESDLGVPIHLEWIQRFRMNLRINSRREEIRGNMLLTAYISIPDYNVYAARIRLTGRYSGFLTHSSAVHESPSTMMASAVVPEPVSLLLFGAGAAFLMRHGRRKRNL